jgi:hypothetical protein
LKIGDAIRLNVGPLSDVLATVRWSVLGVAGVRFVDGDWT